MTITTVIVVFLVLFHEPIIGWVTNYQADRLAERKHRRRLQLEAQQHLQKITEAQYQLVDKEMEKK